MIGKTISHYRISAKLGEGGMGAVYRAEDVTLQREVALKFLPGDVASNPDARKRLLQEARAASRLNHPNIATIYEVNEAGDTPFIAMELVVGESLKQVLQRGAIPPGRVVEIARQIAEGLLEAHQAGVLHRDIKPANVMLDSRGRVKILDFGLATLPGPPRDARETVDAFVIRTASNLSTGGTAPYISPEQLRGEPTDSRSDIFSFGVLLFESLAGRLPFAGETSVDVLHAILRSPATPLRSIVQGISVEWEQAVERCLAKPPAQRFASMRDVLEALERCAAPPAHADKSLAVLYFENLSGVKEDEYFRDGITEDIIIELSRIHDLRVFPRLAVFAYRDKPVPATQIGQQLNAAYVLTGSLRRAGERLRITAQLVETRTGHSAWAERYDRQLEDIFAIQDEIAQNIASALRVMLTEKEKRAIQKVQTTDVQAYDYYLRGRQFFYQFSRKGIEHARQMFARAIVMDASYARAYAGVADCCSFLYMYWEATDENLKEADTASRKALQLDPESPEAHAARGLAASLRKEYEEAHREFDTAIRLNSRLFEAYYFCARSYVAQGNLEQAAHSFNQAIAVNPQDYASLRLLACAYAGLGRLAEAQAADRRALEVIERHLEFYPDDARAWYMGAQAFCQLGDVERSIEWASKALAADPEETSILYNVACVYALQGKSDEALECLEKATHLGFGQREWIENDSDLESLRGLPRFREFLNQLPDA